MTLVEHLESNLGELSGGWKDSNSENSIRIVSFENQPYLDIITYSTLGMSNFVLPMASGNRIRQELIFTAYRSFQKEQIASFLSTFAEQLVSSEKALLRGNVVGPSAPIIWGSPLNSTYSAIPVVFDDRLTVYYGTVPETVFAWVIPIHEEEANYIRKNGWTSFEELLEIKKPELWDLQRTSIV